MEESRLRSIPLFADLDGRELEALGRCTDEVDVAEGRELVHEGDFFGELALSGDRRRNASVVAATPLTAIVMTRSAFRQMRRDIPEVCDRIEATVDERGRELADE